MFLVFLESSALLDQYNAPIAAYKDSKSKLHMPHRSDIKARNTLVALPQKKNLIPM